MIQFLKLYGMKQKPNLLFLLLLLFTESCIEPFTPPEITGARQYLVVDGFLNTSPNQESQFRLTRTQTIAETGQPMPESRARLFVEGDAGSRFTLSETANGLYILPPIAAKDNEKYRIHILTQDGNEYYSSYEPIIRTPAIDSLTYEVREDRSGVQININTHDPRNATRFYRWNFEETWQYYSDMYSPVEYINGAVVGRLQDISTCWSFAKSSRIVLGTSVKLSQDIIKDQPITYVAAATGKLKVKYSVLVRQYGLSQEEYEYWTTLAKTTEGTGTLFDPQPSQVRGNIMCVSDPSALVFGYFSASTQQEERLFVAESLGRYATSCAPVDTLSLGELAESFDKISEEYIPTGSTQTLYVMAFESCVDCRLRGGTTVRPPFWR